ncbi:PaaR repeat-containing protein [Motiliproteus coralliicola]|uniref:PaaR repeat-containing protein n=1 Tax=Motiliproteus coralliicola TaxID=2283196 RepID=A0A369WSM0_9GAMM|nr:PAAR domain-containing protein [Motiliproteus coralliicola]RDE24682.1 PaaR repeat-containing protein [Motiliproteus coralliicola]
MAGAARLGDTTNHGGTLIGPGNATVLIGGMPAAVLGDTHICSLPPNVHQPTVSPFILGSSTVLIGNVPAIRAGDSCLCGASVIIGDPTVIIG